MTFPPQLARAGFVCRPPARFVHDILHLTLTSSSPRLPVGRVLGPLFSLPFSADNGEEFLPNRFVKSCAWAGSYKSLAHYCTRGWCRLEMLLGQTEPLPQDGFMFNFLVPKKKKVSLKSRSVSNPVLCVLGGPERTWMDRWRRLCVCVVSTCAT